MIQVLVFLCLRILNSPAAMYVKCVCRQRACCRDVEYGSRRGTITISITISRRQIKWHSRLRIKTYPCLPWCWRKPMEWYVEVVRKGVNNRHVGLWCCSSPIWTRIRWCANIRLCWCTPNISWLERCTLPSLKGIFKGTLVALNCWWSRNCQWRQTYKKNNYQSSLTFVNSGSSFNKNKIKHANKVKRLQKQAHLVKTS